MKRFPIIGYALIIIFANSCEANNDKKIETLAEEFCNCLKAYKNTISEETTRILLIGINSNDTRATIEAEARKLDLQLQIKVGQEIYNIGALLSEGPSGDCVKEIENRYGEAYSFNHDDVAKKAVAFLEKKGGCSFATLIIRFGMRAPR